MSAINNTNLPPLVRYFEQFNNNTGIPPSSVSNGTGLASDQNWGNISGTFMSPTTNLHEIRGEMIAVTKKFNELDFLECTPDQVKKLLLNLLAGELMKHDCVEFTQAKDPIDYSTVVRARIFATQDDMVRLIRVNIK